MTTLEASESKYLPVSQNEADDVDTGWEYDKRRWTAISVGKLILIMILCLLGGYALGMKAPLRSSGAIHHPSKRCVDPSLRREWRSLSDDEKQEYISAVQCLRRSPSRTNMSQSLYDDFPVIHTRIGNYSHGAAAFLSWHRAFLHIFERTLKEQCNYSGAMVYWDWTLDWANLTASPIWSSTTGFGGDGNISATDDEPIQRGHCVSDGPFADLQVPWYGPLYQPHCLSRGFTHGRRLQKNGLFVRPEAIESLMRISKYEQFFLDLEEGAHLAIPKTIQGDFALFTAPYDPVFMLHHGQLDRLWWLWQNRDWANRAHQYEGPAATNSSSRASITDMLPFGDLTLDVKVSDIIETEGQVLCYRY
ncbi:MAG: hypothetical protein M1820_005848 [Bogoriella megaspora]|nr:MAG: hypothetical protein M1820_005848 [Bogoriella megaspora]